VPSRLIIDLGIDKNGDDPGDLIEDIYQREIIVDRYFEKSLDRGTI
jgi:hypothetical protein